MHHNPPHKGKNDEIKIATQSGVIQAHRPHTAVNPAPRKAAVSHISGNPPKGNSKMDTSDIPNTPEGSLVWLARKLQLAMGIDPYALKWLVDQFVTKAFHTSPNSRTHFAKVNIYNELTKPKMTIKVFFKFLRIVKIKKFTFVVRATLHNDKIVEVEHDFNVFQGGMDEE